MEYGIWKMKNGREERKTKIVWEKCNSERESKNRNHFTSDSRIQTILSAIESELSPYCATFPN